MREKKAGRLFGIALAAGVVVLVTAALIFLRHGADTSSGTLRVFCGAASKPAMEECAGAFEKKTGISVELQFSGSGTMLSRLKIAKRGDIFVPGSPDYLIKAEREGVVDPKRVKIIAYLVPAILVQKGNPKGIDALEDLAEPGMTVGIGNPEAVCVGLYAVEILEKSALLEKVGKNVVVHAESCSKTAALLAMKRVDAVIGWRVFSKWNPQDIDAVLLEPAQIPRLSYIPAGICTWSANRRRAGEFVEFLTSPEGAQIFAKWGYIAGAQDARKFAPEAQVGGQYDLPADYGVPTR